ncbi:MAG: hypothetical protein NTW25_01150 [Candidatus Kapabacteria bacterium]|nr:hypothetical protein [Candidatus Kapabacteria bacterium]
MKKSKLIQIFIFFIFILINSCKNNVLENLSNDSLINGKIINLNGKPVLNAKIICNGIDFTYNVSTYSDSLGKFTLNVDTNKNVEIYATINGISSAKIKIKTPSYNKSITINDLILDNTPPKGWYIQNTNIGTFFFILLIIHHLM